MTYRFLMWMAKQMILLATEIGNEGPTLVYKEMSRVLAYIEFKVSVGHLSENITASLFNSEAQEETRLTSHTGESSAKGSYAFFQQM